MAEIIRGRRFETDITARLVKPGLSRPEMVERTFQTLLQAHSQLNTPIRASLAGEGLSLSHVILLENLIMRGEANATQLAEAMSLTNGAVTQLLKKLEAVGLVTRTRRDEDRRIVHVQATHRARDRFERLHASTTSELAEAFDGWALQDIEKLQHLLTRLTLESR